MGIWNNGSTVPNCSNGTCSGGSELSYHCGSTVTKCSNDCCHSGNYMHSEGFCGSTVPNCSSSSSNDDYLYQNILLKINKIYDIISQINYKKEEKSMSFVGIIKTKEGFIGFGDGKSSVPILDGYSSPVMLQEDRGVIKKVFKNNNFIICNYGTNQISKIVNNVVTKIKNIEDYIEENIKDCTADTFLKDFQIYLGNNNCSKTYNFIYAEKNKEHIYSVCVSSSKIELILCGNNNGKCWGVGGIDAYYIDFENKIINAFSSSNEEAKIILHNYLNNTYNKIDAICKEKGVYNPVDNNFIIEEI